jgi:hypothetical protein
MTAIYVHSLIFGNPEILVFKKYPSTAISYLLWGSVWLNTALLYHFISDGVFSISHNYGVILIFFNIGSVAIFGSAIAYARGNQLIVKKDFNWLIGLLVFMMFWNLVSQRFATGFLSMTITIAPSVILSSTSLIFFGWVFFVRWGGVLGILYLLCVALYSILQFPAYMAIFLKPYFVSLQDIEVVYSLLAGMKIPLISGFMVFLLNSLLPSVKIHEERFLPATPVSLPASMHKAIYWILGAIVTAAITVLTNPIWKFLVSVAKPNP